MAEVINFETFEEFMDYNKAFINENTLLNYNIIQVSTAILDNRLPVREFYNIVGENEDSILAIFTEESYLLYSSRWDNDMMETLVAQIEFDKFKRFPFMGTKSLIENLFNYHNSPFFIVKERNMYACKELNKSFSLSSGACELAGLSDLAQLGRMTTAFVKEYDGKDKGKEASEAIAFSGIHDQDLYTWSYNKQIVAMAQAMLKEHDFPVIGQVFTNKAFRRQGFAASLVYSVTELLLGAGHAKCCLVADATNPYSNKAFIRVGYKKIGDYIVVSKEKIIMRSY